MNIGNFSVSLKVADLQKSLGFYSSLGFEQVSGDASQGWLVLQNGEARIGIFQDILEENLLTFNPKWDKNKETVPGMPDVREIAEKMAAEGYQPEQASFKAGDGTEGSGYFYLTDPDGNKLLFDQYV